MNDSGNQVDASGNGYVVIRFTAPDGETVPWAKVYSHAFQTRWLVHENSLTKRTKIQ